MREEERTILRIARIGVVEAGVDYTYFGGRIDSGPYHGSLSFSKRLNNLPTGSNSHLHLPSPHWPTGHELGNQFHFMKINVQTNGCVRWQSVNVCPFDQTVMCCLKRQCY